jgi:hypothetical protein
MTRGNGPPGARTTEKVYVLTVVRRCRVMTASLPPIQHRQPTTCGFRRPRIVSRMMAALANVVTRRDRHFGFVDV